ncbi:MAG: DUF2752 domain-containing protein [Sphingobacteriales bacterium]|nr:MAG: DUF2752 domain-containing protein [Sphingobacteriales bacterium]
MKGRRLYLFLLSLCACGYAWLWYSYPAGHTRHAIPGCLFRNVTGIPCPACGITRALLCLMQGEVKQALYTNPLAFAAALFLIITPLWCIADLLLRRVSLAKQYFRAEHFLQKRPVAMISIVLIIINWIWNISKGL